jgi:hypothetical protein
MIITETIMATLQDLHEEVRKNHDVVGSAVALLEGIKDRLDEAITACDPQQFQTLSDELGENTHQLAKAIAETNAA